MPLVVLIKKQFVVIEKEWLENKNKSDLMNNGVLFENYAEKKVFYSPNINDKPNFNLPVSTKFEEDKVGCHNGFIIKYFGNMI